MSSVKNFLSLIKFSHTVFALPFAMAGFFLAVAHPSHDFNWQIFIPVILCMVFARTAAMAFNRWLDRSIDAINPRTRNREIPAGKISPSGGLTLSLISSLLFIATTWFINELCFYLSPVAVFVVLFYSYTKRFTWLCHWVLGTGLALAPVGAYIAVTGTFAVEPILLSVTVLFWVGGFDVLYALQDEDFDKKNRLQSVPSFLGKKRSKVIAGMSHFLSVSALTLLWYFFIPKYFFLAGIGVFAFLLFMEHFTIHRKGDTAIAPVFFNYNSWAGVLLCAGFIGGLYWG